MAEIPGYDDELVQRVDRAVNDASFPDGADGIVEFDASTATWWMLAEINSTEGTLGPFELQFQLLTDESSDSRFLIFRLILLPPDMVSPAISLDMEFYALLNTVAWQPGGRWRLMTDAEMGVSVVCESDLPVELVNADTVHARVTRLLGIGAYYGAEIIAKATALP